MPDKKYWDKKQNKEVVLASDYFRCGRCLGSKFSYEINYLFQSGESDKQYKQTCLDCGEIFFTDRKYNENEKGRFILLEDKLKEDKKNEIKVNEE